MTTTPMLDLASYDGREILTTDPYTYVYHPIDWAQARSRWPAAIIKQGQGLASDPLFALQYRASQGLIARGVYHYFTSSVNAIQAATKMLQDVQAAQAGWPELGFWLDVEANPSAMPGTAYLPLVASFLNEIYQRGPYGATIGVYSRASFWDPLWTNAGKPTWPANYWAWVARYPYSPTSAGFLPYYDAVVHKSSYPVPPPLMGGFTKLAAWQWTANGKPEDVPGYPVFKKAVDFNLLYLPLPGVTPPEPSDAEKLKRLWDAHPELW